MRPKGSPSWRRVWLPTPGFSPGESHGQRNLGGYSPWGVGHDWVTKHAAQGGLQLPCSLPSRLPTSRVGFCYRLLGGTYHNCDELKSALILLEFSSSRKSHECKDSVCFLSPVAPVLAWNLDHSPRSLHRDQIHSLIQEMFWKH